MNERDNPEQRRVYMPPTCEELPGYAPLKPAVGATPSCAGGGGPVGPGCDDGSLATNYCQTGGPVDTVEDCKDGDYATQLCDIGDGFTSVEPCKDGRGPGGDCSRGDGFR